MGNLIEVFYATSQRAAEADSESESFLGCEQGAVGHHLLRVRIPREDQPQRNVQNRNRESNLAAKRRAITRKEVLAGFERLEYGEHRHRCARRLNLSHRFEALFPQAARIERCADVEEG